MNELALRCMNRKGWSQKKLGEEMGLTEPEISKIINYRRAWTWQLAERFKSVSGEDVRIFRA